MEGIASEAASLAGHLRLGRLVYLYDDNDDLARRPDVADASTEDVAKRFEAYGWHALHVDDVNDLDALGAAIQAGIDEDERPTLIRVKTIIGWPAPNKQGTSKAHGAPLGEDEVRATKEVLGWDPDEHVPRARRRLRALRPGRARRRGAGRVAGALRGVARRPRRARRGVGRWPGRTRPSRCPASTRRCRHRLGQGQARHAQRGGSKAMAAFAAFVADDDRRRGRPDRVDQDRVPRRPRCSHGRDAGGRNVYFGVREHGMGGAVNGMAAHGGIVRPYGSTFLQFADYMRGAIRLSAL